MKHYSKEFENYVREKAKTMKKDDLYNNVIKKYKLDITKKTFCHYLHRHNIRAIDYDASKVTKKPFRPIGSEIRYKDGMIKVKVGQPSQYEYKQRIMYKKYHNCELTRDDFIIFLNQDKNDFSKENLFKVSRRESAMLAGVRKMTSTNRELTKLGILNAKLMLKAKEVKNEANNSKRVIQCL